MSSAPQLLEQGLTLHRRGDLAGAQLAYERVLAVDPGHADALHLMGLLAHQAGRSDLAAKLIARALERRPDVPIYYYNLGAALRALGRPDEARACYEQAARLQPGLAGVWDALVEIFFDTGEAEAAQRACAEACAANPGDYALRVNLGFVLRQHGLGSAARAMLEEAVALAPASPEARLNLGLVCLDLGQNEAAGRHFEQGLAAAPDHAGLANALGIVLQARLRPDEAERHYRHALRFAPDNHEAHNNLATAMLEQGRQREAIAEFDAALALQPDYLNAASNRLMAFCYVEEDARTLAEAHFEYGRRFPPAPPLPARAPDEVLRIGFVSGDFREHPLQYFLEPLLEHLDRSACRLFAYSACAQEDTVSARLKGAFDAWRPIAGVADAEAASRIAADGIDVLIDLSVHTGLNRLPLFARRAAPVQLSWLGYPGPTGIAAMDGLLVDGILAPADAPTFGGEDYIRLPVYRPYRAPSEAPPVAPPPWRQHGQLTFASLNGFAKITPAMLELWADVLAAAPGARLLFAAAPGERRCGEVEELFARRGVGRERLEWLGRVALADYLAMHGRIDVALDSYPFGGGTTAFHAIWMGVPVLTLCGQTLPSRAGASLLEPLGLGDWVAHDRSEYLGIAADIVRAPERLDDLRAGMRQRFAASPHADAAAFAAAFLAACAKAAGRNQD